jgi:transcriptional regulator with PAS, ATPase and Fis domain
VETETSGSVLDGIIGNSAAMRALSALVLKVAPHDCTVLICGESGTGKELIARSIKTTSKRASGPFVTVNCGAMPETLTEALLFGHERGSFTGASSDKRGLFEAANGGTIFLDEVGEMPLPIQVKLLRALQEREIVRLGSTKSIRVDVRVVAATNRDLKALIAEGSFRQDLYYRIATFAVYAPPLRERQEDIPLLVHYFLDKLYGANLHRPPALVESDAMDLLARYDWPGNVRELENVINRLVVVAGQSGITLGDVENVLRAELGSQSGFCAESGPDAPREKKLVLPSNTAELSEDETIRAYMRRVKLDVFTAAVSQYPDKTAAAERLGLTKETLRRQMRYLRQVAARSTSRAANDQETYE